MLSDRQYTILEFIHQHTHNHGFMPSIREICNGTRINSTSVVKDHLIRLSERGYLIRASGKARAFVLTRQARALFGDEHNTDVQKLHEQIHQLCGENQQLRLQMRVFQRKHEDVLRELEQLREIIRYPD